MFKLNSDGIWNNVTKTEFEDDEDWAFVEEMEFK